ncbi:TetR/AcrR family transcriptional regulator [Phenylobacterium sp.]|uniref:TetR/AcrR family transcriptional regulator n=1 Tax=Phenylobacterium sp. TaxID=1871053 RepID=UPI00301BA8CD
MKAAGDDLALRNAPLQKRAHERMAAILEAAHAVLRRDGAEAATVTGIAQEAGIAVGSFYHYFPNKEAAFLALYEGKLAALREFATATELPAGDRREALRAWIVALKEEELRIGFDFALFDAVHHYSRLAAIAARHAEAMALATAARLRALGSTWSEAALFDLCLNAFFMNASSWLYWRASGGYAPRAITRLADAVVAVVEPAMDGSPEPLGPHLRPQGSQP